MRKRRHYRTDSLGSRTTRLIWAAVNAMALALIAYFAGACSGSSVSSSSSYTSSKPAPKPGTKIEAQHAGSASPVPGQTATTTIAATGAGAKRAVGVSYIWTPPFDFIETYRFPGRQPDNPAGPPPFIFSDVPLVSGSQYEAVAVEFDWPPLPAGLNTLSGVETIQLKETGGLGEPDPVHFFYTLAAQPARSAAEDLRLAPVSSSGRKTYDYLAYEQMIDGSGLMTPSLCQRYVDALTSGDYFYAIQLPAVAVDGSPTAYRLPFATYGEEIRPRAELRSWASGQMATGFNAPLKREPRYLTCLENELPRAEGKHWLALVAEPSVFNYCADFPPNERWFVELFLFFHQEALEQDLLTYVCYRGEDPLLRALFARASTELGLEFLQQRQDGCCLACLGPVPMSITQDYSHMELLNTSADFYVQPAGRRVAFKHILNNAPDVATLRYEYLGDEQELEWGFYDDVAGQYDLAAPITGAGPFSDAFWFVSEPVTGAVRKGLYSMKVIATLPSQESAWSTNFINVGELLGDLNQDELLNAIDLLLLANVLADNLRLDDGLLQLADLDFNRRVDVSDLILMEEGANE